MNSYLAGSASSLVSVTSQHSTMIKRGGIRNIECKYSSNREGGVTCDTVRYYMNIESSTQPITALPQRQSQEQRQTSFTCRTTHPATDERIVLRHLWRGERSGESSHTNTGTHPRPALLTSWPCRSLLYVVQFLYMLEATTTSLQHAYNTH